MLKSDLDWVEANPKLAAQLDALVGTDVYLVRDHGAMNGISVYPKGGKLKVLERWRDRLHALWNEYTILQVRPDWVASEPPGGVKKEPKREPKPEPSPEPEATPRPEPMVRARPPKTRPQVGHGVWVQSPKPCRYCKSIAQHFTIRWESGWGGSTDEKHECRACGGSWWVEGIEDEPKKGLDSGL